jgi:hypothetical protein
MESKSRSVLPTLADLRHGKSNPGIGMRQIDPTGKSLLIFRNRVKPLWQKYFASLPTQISSLIRTVPFRQEGRFAIVTNAGRDAVDAKASGAHWQSQGEMNLVSGFAGVQDDRRFLRTVKPCGSDTRCWC